jgi:DNA-binding beta-propeller fold protein YncE
MADTVYNAYQSRVVNAVAFPDSATWLNTDEPLTLKGLRGKMVLLDFWTYCCINCMHVMPDLRKLEEEFPSLVVVGVHSAKFSNEQQRQNIRNAILRYDIHHPVIVDNAFKLWDAYGAKAWPSFVLIAPNGKVVDKTTGENIYNRWQDKIRRLRDEFAERGELDQERRDFALEQARTPGSYLAFPGKIVADKQRDRLLFTDSNHHRVVVADESGRISTVIGSGRSGRADGSFEEAELLRPQGLAYDAARQVLYIADTDNHLIRKANLKTQQVTTVLGTGEQARQQYETVEGTQQPLNSPWDLHFYEGDLLIAMAGEHRLWRMDTATHRARVYAGSGAEALQDSSRRAAALAQPSGLADLNGRLIFADSEASAIRYVAQDAVRTYVGEGLFAFGDRDGPMAEARLQHPIGVATGPDDKLYIADTYNHKIKVLDPGAGTVRTLIGTGERGMADGPLAEAQLNEPNDMAWLNGKLYITDTNNDLIRVYDPATNRLSTLALEQMKRLDPLAVSARGAADQTGRFSGQRVELPRQAVAPGRHQLQLTIEMPEGYKLNRQAPNFIGLRGQEKAGELTQQRDRLVASLSPTIAEDQQALQLEAAVYYCEARQEARCLIQRYAFEVPLTVSAGAAARAKPIELSYRIRPAL